MKQRDDGGTAFPMQDAQAIHAYAFAKVAGVDDVDERDRLYMQARRQAVGGMSLRDYFAGRAMHAEIVTCGVPGEACEAMIEAMQPGESVEDSIARTAYRMADAMLKARTA